MKLKKRLIKEYVLEILKENESGYSLYGDSSSQGLYGGNYPDYGTLYKAFVEPLKDVVGVTVGKTKETIRRSITLLQVAFEATMTTLIPFLTDSYDEIWAAESAAIDKIESEYGEYYRKADEVFQGGPLAIAMLAFPGPTLLGKFAKDTPAAAKSILSVATGGISDKYLSSGKGKTPSSIFDSYAINYKNILSEDSKDFKEKKEKTLADKIGSAKFINAMLERSPMMVAASRDAQQIFRTTLDNALNQAIAVLSAKRIEDIEKITGEKIDALDELSKIKEPETKKKAEQEILKKIKNSIKLVYIKKLQDQINPFIEIFGEDHPYVLGYQEVISKIEKF